MVFFIKIASFNATLEDASLADLIIHVRDVSNADHLAQNDHVLKTLENLQVPEKLISSMITVGNKIDLLSSKEDLELVRQDGMIPISTKNGDNMEELFHLIDETIVKCTGRTIQNFRVPTGGELFNRLLKETSVAKIDTCPEDANYSTVESVLFCYQVKDFKVDNK